MSEPFEDFAKKTVNNPLYRDLKLKIFEDSRTWVPNPANPEVGWGLFQGVLRTFEKIEEYAKFSLEDSREQEKKKQKDKSNPETPKSSDPDFE